MIDVLRIAHLRIAPQEGNLEVGNCEGNQVIIYSLLVVLPPVLLALLMSGNTWELNSSRLSPTTTNFLCHYPTLSDPIFFYLYISHFIRSHILLLHKKLIFNISGECTIQAPTHYKSGLMLFAFISRAMASFGNCYVVGSRFVECYNQFTSWEHELHN